MTGGWGCVGGDCGGIGKVCIGGEVSGDWWCCGCEITVDIEMS